jgi:hypothetical protein
MRALASNDQGDVGRAIARIERLAAAVVPSGQSTEKSEGPKFKT